MVFLPVCCPHCQSDQVVKRGKTAQGKQRYLCRKPESAILNLASSPGFWFRWNRLEALQHEIHQRLPRLKAQVTGQSPDVVEQAFS